MASEKTKHKQGEYGGVTRYFRQTVPFEFIVAYSPEGCAERLNGLASPQNFYTSTQNPIMNVGISILDNDLYEFSIRRRIYREANISVRGFLERYELSSTLVKGTITQREYLLLYFPFLVILLCFLWPIAPLILVWYILRRYNNYMETLDLVKSTLGSTQK